VEALQRHDGTEVDGILDENADSFDTRTSKSWDAKTFKTWATNFTQCTNMTFSNVHKLWNSNSAIHKEVSKRLLIVLF
jgi:hypothetical protein